MAKARVPVVAVALPAKKMASAKSFGVAQKTTPKVNAKSKSKVEAQVKSAAKPKSEKLAASSLFASDAVAAPTPKAKRTRVPRDLAAQYGERVNLKAEARPVAEEAKPRRPRRDAAARAKLKELLRPDEDLVERLARANTIGVVKSAPSRRTKNWQTRCGKCGTNGSFAVAAALCPRCGTILIRSD